MRKQPTRNRQMAKYRLEQRRFLADFTRKINRREWLLLGAMAVMLIGQACTKHLTPGSDREAPVPTAQKEGKQV